MPPNPKLPREPVPLPASVEPLAPPPEFLAAVAGLGIELDAPDAERLGYYLALLLAANQTMNLTAITDPMDAWLRHIADALTLVPVLSELPEGASVVDIGSGGGVPGIPLAIAMPKLRFTLLEATGKKVAFLREAVSRLRLTNVAVAQARAEDAGRTRPGQRAAAVANAPGLRETFDAATARAVGKLAVLVELAIPLLKVGGLAAFIKGQKADEELAEAANALKTLHATHAGTIDTPTGKVIVLEKTAPTQRNYPRPAGEPTKHPL